MMAAFAAIMCFSHSMATNEASERSLTLLRRWLTPQQREEFDKFKTITVFGSETGRKYVINDDNVYNVQVYSDTNEHVADICFLPVTCPALPRGDILLAQKLALETDERHVWEAANVRTKTGYAGELNEIRTVDIPAITIGQFTAVSGGFIPAHQTDTSGYGNPSSGCFGAERMRVDSSVPGPDEPR